MFVFVSRPMKIVTFPWKNNYTPKRVVEFSRERDTFRNKIIEIVEDFDEKITTTMVNPGNRRGFCVRIEFFIFLYFFLFFVSFFHFFICSFA